MRPTSSLKKENVPIQDAMITDDISESQISTGGSKLCDRHDGELYCVGCENCCQMFCVGCLNSPQDCRA